MNFLLVIPRWVDDPEDYYDFPLGIAYVSSALKAAGFKVTGCNLNHAELDPRTELLRAIERNAIDVLCIGGGSTDAAQIHALLSAAKAARPGIITVLGGAIFTSEPELMLRSLPVDVGIIGEAELTVVELARALEQGTPLRDVAGLAFLGASRAVVTTQARPVIEDLDAVAFPDYEGFELDECLRRQSPLAMIHLFPLDRPRCIPMTLSRSCPFKCTFCYHPLGDRYRSRSLDNFFAELDSLRSRFDFNMVSINDDLIAAKRERILEFCRRMTPYGLKWMAQLRVDHVDEELLAALKGSGCHLISFGIESTDDRVLLSMNKKTTRERIETALALTRQAGIGIQGNLIFGDPEETGASALATLEWWLAHVDYQLNLSFIMAFPGSKIYLDAVRAGKLERTSFIKAGCPPINLSRMTDEEYQQLHVTVRALRMSQRCPGKLLSLEASEEYHHPRHAVFKLSARCPHCQEVSRYDNVIPAANWYKGYDARLMKLGCRSCSQRMDLDIEVFRRWSHSPQAGAAGEQRA